MSGYETTVGINEFKGLMQYGSGLNTDMRYAVEAKNIETRAGVLQPAAACKLLPPVLDQPIETLARLHRRWYSSDSDKELLVAASGGQLFYMLPGDSEWTMLPMPDGRGSYASNTWSWVSYEINPEGSSASVDVLLMSNALDGMIMLRGDDLSVSVVQTPKKFGTIERYAERIWGGAIVDDPDMLVYSAPYDPTNWAANVEIPEDGAGDLNQPSWDGDSFTALRAFGSQLIAFKKTRVWRILGTDPGEYAFKEQYGGGAPYAETVAVDNERILMLSNKGVQVYDGLSVSPFMQEYCEKLWARINLSAIEQATAIMWKHKYYVSVPLDGSLINNAVITYDPVDGTWLVREDVSVEHFLGTEDFLYFSSATTPGQVWEWREDSWATGEATPGETTWESPWTDLGAKNVVKGGFDLYFLCEVQDRPVTLQFVIQTEKKLKIKNYTVQPLSDEDRLKGKSHRQKRLHFGGTGRRLKLRVSAAADGAAWRLNGGLQLLVETDPD